MTSNIPVLPPPSRRSEGIAVRRGVVLVLMSLIIPGSAQAAAGNKRVGRIALSVWLTLLALGAVLLVSLFVARAWVIGLLANPILLTVVAWLIPVFGLAWILLLVDAWRIANPGRMSLRGRSVTGAIALVLAFTLGAGSLWTHGVVKATGQLMGSDVFGGGGTTETDNGRLNVLLLGGDAGESRTGLRPDTIMVASIDANTGRTVLFSLPRNLQHAPFPEDSPLHDEYPDGYWCKSQECLLNAVYTEAMNHKKLFPGVKYPGVEATKGVVEETLGLSINYWAMIDLKGFEQLIDAVGGITLDISKRVPIGSKSGKRGVYGHIEPGKGVHLDGFNALWFARSREGASDYERMSRQKCVINAMVKQLNPTTVLTKFEAITEAGKQVVATNLPSSEIGSILDLAVKMREIPMASVNFSPPLIKPANPDFNKIRKIVADTIADSEAKDKPTPKATETPADTPEVTSPNPSTSPSKKPSSKPSSSSNQTDNLDSICSASK